MHWHNVEHLVTVGAQAAQGTAAIRAGATTLCGLVDDLFARQMRREGPHRRETFRLSCNRLVLGDRAGLGFEFFERQLELGDGVIQLLGRRAELHPPHPGDLGPQRLDQHIAGGKGCIGGCRISPQCCNLRFWVRGKIDGI